MTEESGTTYIGESASATLQATVGENVAAARPYDAYLPRTTSPASIGGNDISSAQARIVLTSSCDHAHQPLVTAEPLRNRRPDGR